MWKRKELKSKSKKVVKNNYWTAVVVCFLIALLTGEFGFSVLGLLQSDDSIDPNYIRNEKEVIEKVDEVTLNNSMKFPVIDKDKVVASLSDGELKVAQVIKDNLNSAIKTQKYIFRISDAVLLFSMRAHYKAIALCVSALLAFSFKMFIADPLIVGGKRYFLKARKDDKTKAGEAKEVFRKDNWLNVAIIMLLRNIYNALWYLTIIGGFIKKYEYIMIPYILAENPKIKRKEAFELSKQMMKHNKWNTFVLDLSFVGWSILSVITRGLLNVLYVNPYYSATFAELYMNLRENAIKNKYKYYEALNDKSL